jgi:hypothetical protein
VKILCFFFSFVVQYTIKLDDYMPGKDVNLLPCMYGWDIKIIVRILATKYIHRNQNIFFISFLYNTFRVKNYIQCFLFLIFEETSLSAA